jgi:carbonic anhydrase/acetyltransferase-like protein (isoleucine patch superfamily)
MPDYPINTTRVIPDETQFIAPTATVIGAVSLGEGASVWYGASVRADLAPIVIGARSNVQDNASIHVDPGLPAIIGDDVTIGHNAVVHGATVGDGCLIGMGSIVLNRAVIGAGSLIAAGTVVREGMQVPPGSLVAGVPGKVLKTLSPAQQAHIRENAGVYIASAAAHRAANR